MGTPSSRRGRKQTDSCKNRAAALLLMAGSLVGFGAFLGEAARWVL